MDMSGIREITRKPFERIGSHSHIRGLGLKDFKALPVADGFVGQIEAREAAGLIVAMVKAGKMAGRAILLAGPPGTGKTAIALGIAKELGEDVPFVMLAGSEIYSEERKKTEILQEALRKAMGVRIHEMRKIYQGVVDEFQPKLVRNPYNPYQQLPESAKLTLRTKKEKKSFEVGQQVAMNFINQNITPGDVVMIDAETGRVTRMGRAQESTVKHYDIEPERLVDVPDGPILTEKEFVYTMTLADLDEMQARRSGFGLFGLLFSTATEKEIDPEIRKQVDQAVREMVEEGRAEIIPGVLFIDESHMLDIEAYSFLNRAMESELAPIIILASNRGITKIRGTDIRSPHGLPLDLLDRVLIINTKPYSKEEIYEIIKIRAAEEGAKLDEEAHKRLTEIGVEASLRYSVQLLGPAVELAKKRNPSDVVITVEDIETARRLFADVKQSVKYVQEQEKAFMLDYSVERSD
ncbi:MAG: TATA box-binding protein [Candidatus Asgardarchaeum californiense]|nr:MAG: TATA box-binding protein [Candidatus Asgardarchaeum californiense]